MSPDTPSGPAGPGEAGRAQLLTADLVPHGPRAATPEPTQDSALRIQARAERRAGELQLTYTLTGPLAHLRLPAPQLQPQPQRRDELWQHTCLEAFLAVAGQEGYWELNLAPAGDWNLYRLDGYRRNLRAEPALQALPVEVTRTAGRLDLRAALPLPAPLAQAAELELGLTAVLEHDDGALSYWALAHPPGEPDFHWRGGWRRCR